MTVVTVTFEIESTSGGIENGCFFRKLYLRSREGNNNDGTDGVEP